MKSIKNDHAGEFAGVGSVFSLIRQNATASACVLIVVVICTMTLLAPRAVNGALNSAWQWVGNGIEIEHIMNNDMSGNGLLLR